MLYAMSVGFSKMYFLKLKRTFTGRTLKMFTYGETFINCYLNYNWETINVLKRVKIVVALICIVISLKDTAMTFTR